MRVLVQYQDQPAAVRLQCDDCYGSLLQAVQSHRHAASHEIDTMWYHYAMPDGTKVKMEIDEGTFPDLQPDKDIVHVTFSRPFPVSSPITSQIEATRPSMPNGDSSDKGGTATVAGWPSPRGVSPVLKANDRSTPPGASSSSPSRPLIPRLNLTPEVLSLSRPSEASPQRRGREVRVTSVPEALKFLSKSSGTIEAVKVPQFLRSISCPFDMDRLWKMLRMCRLTPTGFIPHRDLLVIVEHFSGAKNGDPVFHDPILNGHSGEGESTSRPRKASFGANGVPLSPNNPFTPRTCITARDQLPLGASAISPLPAGRCIQDLLGVYDSCHSSTDNSRDGPARSGGEERLQNGKKRLRKSHSMASMSSFKTVHDANELWPAYNGLTHTNGARAGRLGRAGSGRMSNGVSKGARESLSLRTLHVLRGTHGTGLTESDLPLVLALLHLPASPASISALLDDLAIPHGAILKKRELAHILARLRGLPADQALHQSIEHLEAALYDSEEKDDDPPAPKMNGNGNGHHYEGGAAGRTPPDAPQRPLARGDSGGPAGMSPADAGLTKRHSSHTNGMPRMVEKGSDTSTARHTGVPLPLRCAVCQKPQKSSQRLICGNCRIASYCSVKCQEADWPSHQPICDTVSQHRTVKKINIMATYHNHSFCVQACPSNASMQTSPSKEVEKGAQYLLIVSQRVPVIEKVFIVLTSVTGQCEFSYPPLQTVNDNDVHVLLYQIFLATFHEALSQDIWSLAACCLGPLRGYLCKEASFSTLIDLYHSYYCSFLSDLAKMSVCEGYLRYNVVVLPLETLSEAYESKAIQLGESDPQRFVEVLSQAKDYYLKLLAFIQDTTFRPAQLQAKADADRKAVMRKLAVVYQHLAAKEKGTCAMSYLQQSETVLRRLTDEEPTAQNFELLALLYDCVPSDPSYRSKAVQARQRALSAKEHHERT